MSFTEIVNGTGELIQSSFLILKSLKQTPNIIFISVFSALFIGWVIKMVKYNKEAEKSGSMK